MRYITGDTHGEIDMGKLNMRNWPLQKQLTRDDFLFICGDFGCVWYGNRKDNFLLNWHENKNYTTLWVDGNHENFDALGRYPVEQWHGGKVQFVRPHVIRLMRGQVYEIGGETFFTFGGGLSADRETRREGVSWWAGEAPSEDDMAEAWKNLAAHDYRVDHIITHAAPQSVLWYHLNCRKAAMKLECPCEIFLDEIMSKVTYRKWFCGHYHLDTYVKRMRLWALYDEIISLEEAAADTGDI